MFAEYLKRFSRLRTDKDRNRWSALTTNQAPHKPLVLLSVMDLIAQGAIAENFIEPSFELLDTFNLYFANIMPLGSKGNMAYPFPRLKTDGFWHLVPNQGYENQIDIDFSSMTKLREVCAGAKFDDELFKLLSNPETREQLRAVLIQTYFAPEIHSVVADQGSINFAAYEYGKQLIEEGREKLSYRTEEDQKKEKIRDQGFRKAIVTLYEHRCALCGIRMLTPDGHTVVEAAHIVPWRESHDDKPTNGMCLCRLCHWSFDEGLMSVGKKYEVLVSKRVRTDQNMPGHMLTLTDRQIFKPSEQVFWPSQGNLDWHRKNTYFR
jgi:putative restriction endonuclease